jgi:hypothetical protein
MTVNSAVRACRLRGALNRSGDWQSQESSYREVAQSREPDQGFPRGICVDEQGHKYWIILGRAHAIGEFRAKTEKANFSGSVEHAEVTRSRFRIGLSSWFSDASLELGSTIGTRFLP